MSELSISNVIRVTVQGVQRGVSAKNINEVALFTPELPNNTEPYMIVIDPSDVVKAYGTDSLTSKMAQQVFAQNSNLNTGKGYLVVIPMKNATNAVAAKFTSASISDVSSFASVIDGTLKITVNGEMVELSGLNFTNATTVNDIANILSSATNKCFIRAEGSQIVFESKKFGTTSSIVLSSGDSGTDLSSADYLNVESGSTVSGANATGETLSQAINRTKDMVRYTGVMTAQYVEDDIISAASLVASASDLILVNVWYSVEDILGICAEIKEASQNQTRCLVYASGHEQAKLMMAAYVGRAFSVNFSGSATSQTMNLKTLENVLPDSGISQTDYTNAKASGVDLYVSYEGDAGVLSSGGNGYFDVVYENLALKFAAQAQMYNALKTSGTKVPQTEAGMAILRNALGQVFEQFVRNGVIAAGKWNSPQTFGDPEVFRNNIANQGWYIYSMPIAQQLQSEREQRIAPMIQGACKRAGAIHEADILILVEE